MVMVIPDTSHQHRPFSLFIHCTACAETFESSLYIVAQQHYSVADCMSDSANRYCDRNLGFMLPSSNFYYCIHLSSVKIYVV